MHGIWIILSMHCGNFFDKTGAIWIKSPIVLLFPPHPNTPPSVCGFSCELQCIFKFPVFSLYVIDGYGAVLVLQSFDHQHECRCSSYFRFYYSFSFFRLPMSPPFPWNTAPRMQFASCCTTRISSQVQIERQSVSCVFLCSMQLWYSCVPFCIKIVAHINTLVTVCGGCRECRGFHVEWTRCILINFGLGFRASFFYCHVSLIARFSVTIFRLEFWAFF